MRNFVLCREKKKNRRGEATGCQNRVKTQAFDFAEKIALG